MEKEGGQPKVGVCDLASRVGLQDQVVNNIRWPGVTQNNDEARPAGV